LRRIVKRARWLLLRNRENVPPAQQTRLDELLAANQSLMTVYVLTNGQRVPRPVLHSSVALSRQSPMREFPRPRDDPRAQTELFFAATLYYSNILTFSHS
ncbi:MAG: transposase, partial [Burkholderia sp.]|nr:transposase [Burkholderia sp.]